MEGFTLSVEQNKSRFGAIGFWCSTIVLTCAVVIAAMLGAAAARAQEPPPEDAAPMLSRRPVLALLPMVVHSNEDPNYLRRGLSDMLQARFAKDAAVEIIAVEDAGRATTDLDEALDTARELGAEYVVFGSFTRFGQGASLDVQTAATAAGPDGETLREIFVHSGSIGAVIPDLDDLVGKVTRFALGGADPSSPDAGGSATASAARSASSSDLLRRIQALEAKIGGLEGPSAGH